ncbi:hypothetical protein L6452_40227 [Arctium lappa]|uniref:Uncharacterized protein n=1 Tax=Arctium lappa TaxID=4217 RepID=A0ACB8XKT3_ARCLA|nr:hypothetical protein L6452_40227 [Arctium lappa]
MSTISEASFQHVQGTTSRDLWLALERAYAPHTSSREFTLKAQLLKIQMKGDETSSAYLARAQEYATALANIGQLMSEKDIVMLVVAGLRDEYNGVKQSLLARQFTAVFSELPGLLADHEFLIRKPVPDVTPVQAFTAATAAGSSLQTDTVQALQQLVSRLGFQLQPVSNISSTPTSQAFYTNRSGPSNSSRGRGRGGVELDMFHHNARTATHLPFGRDNRPPITLIIAHKRPPLGFRTHTGSNNHVAPDMTGFDSAESYYGDDSLHVGNAMADEYSALIRNGTWTLVPCVPKANVIACKWVYKIKRDQHGAIQRYKARLIAKGFNQQPGIDYTETLSPVVKSTTIRVVLSLVVTNQWSLRQLDVQNAFLHGDLKETVYLQQPQGNNNKAIDHIVHSLSKSFAVQDMGPLSYFLGIEVARRDSDLILSQRKYINELLARANLSQSKPVPSSCTTSANLSLGNSAPFDDPVKYRQMVGALQYVTLSRLDITFAVNKVCQFMHSPTVNHWSAVKRILRYLHGTASHGLLISRSSSSVLHAYTDVAFNSLSAFFDADWAGCPDDRRSTGGYAIYLGSNLVSWAARKQKIVSRSSTESEYKALADTVAELTWLETLLRELRVPMKSVPTLWCDNLGATYLSVNPVFHARTKHVEVDFHFVREKVAQGKLSVQFISTHDQIVDIFTKPLSSERFLFLKSKLRVDSRP